MVTTVDRTQQVAILRNIVIKIQFVLFLHLKLALIHMATVLSSHLVYEYEDLV